MAKLTDYIIFQRSAGQLAELDGLRGIAILLVLFRHAVNPYWSEAPLLPVYGWDAAILMTNGWIGVDLFFVLSGFLITLHILKINQQPGHLWRWKTYLTKRALRIVPTYYAVLFLAVSGVIPFYPVPENLLGFQVAYHMLFLQDYLPAGIVVAFWSLGVEEKFYLVAPILVMFLRRHSQLNKQIIYIVLFLFCFLILRGITAWQHAEIIEYRPFFNTFRSPFHLTLDPILTGVMLAFIYQLKRQQSTVVSNSLANRVFWLGMSVFVMLISSNAMMDEITWWDKTLQPTVIALACGAITFGLLFGAGAGRLFRSAWLFFFARISYSLYLIHLPMLPLSLEIIRYISPPNHEFPLFCAIYFCTSVIAALLLHYLIEKPFLIIKDNIHQTADAPKTVSELIIKQ